MAIETANMALWYWDVSAGIIQWYAFIPSNLGFTLDVLPHNNVEFWESIHPEDRDLVRVQTIACLKGFSDQFVSEHRFLKPDGTYSWVESRGRIVESNGTQVTKMQGVLMEIGARKRAEEVLRRSSENLKRILNRLPGTILVVDEWGGIRFMTKDEGLPNQPQNFLDWVAQPVQPATRSALHRAIHLNEPGVIEVKMQGISSEWRWYNLHFSPMIHGTEKEAMVIAEDITERKKAEQVLFRLAEGTRGQVGELFFSRIVEHLAETVEADYTIIATLSDKQPGIARTVAVFGPDGIQSNFEYQLEGSPCYDVWQRGICVFPNDVHSLFPKDQMLIEMGIKAYIGVPLVSSTGETIGLMASLFCQPLTERAFQVSTLTVFANRAALELERQRDEQRLNEHRERYELLFATIQDALIMIRESDLTVAEANQKACELYGYEPHEWFGLDAMSLSAEPDLSYQALQELFEMHPSRRHKVERLHRRKDGSTFQVESTLSLMEFRGERIICALVRDVSERIQQQQLLARNTRLLEQSQSASRVGGWEFDRKRKALYWTDQMFLILEFPGSYSPNWEEFMGLVTPEWQPPLERAIERLFNQNQHLDLDLEMFTKNLNRKWVRLVASSSDRNTFFGALQDIHKQKTLEYQLAQTQKVESIGRLAGGVAHDFNNLLTTIIGYSELARDPKTSNLQECLSQISEAAEKGAFLTKQLLGFARKQMSHPQVVDLNEQIHKTTAWLGRLLGEDIQVEEHLQSDLPPVLMDPSQFEQVILNLAINARDAMPEGGKLILESSKSNPSQRHLAPLSLSLNNEQYLCLAIKDSGSGIESEVLPHIFEPFFTTKPVGKGTGLGLSNCYGIMKQNKGFIFADSVPNRGTTFLLYFLIEKQRKVEAAAPSKPISSQVGKEFLLVVEDDELIREMVASFLQKMGYQILTAMNGEEALSLIKGRESEIDMLLTDIVMPKMGGVELTRKLRQIKPDLRVLYTSGYTQKPILENEGSTPPFLPKPFSLPDLSRKVREVLQRN
ncbi:MAG: PAS domain S-box protein [Acidobacteria bacterium]|nr:PAS domain S-box protein [Acidobacteriota bacterium]